MLGIFANSRKRGSKVNVVGTYTGSTITLPYDLILDDTYTTGFIVVMIGTDEGDYTRIDMRANGWYGVPLTVQTGIHTTGSPRSSSVIFSIDASTVSGGIGTIRVAEGFDGNETAITVIHVAVDSWVIENALSEIDNTTNSPSITLTTETSINAVCFCACGTLNLTADVDVYTEATGWTTGAVHNPTGSDDQGGLTSYKEVGALVSESVTWNPTIGNTNADNALSLFLVDIG